MKGLKDARERAWNIRVEGRGSQTESAWRGKQSQDAVP